MTGSSAEREGLLKEAEVTEVAVARKFSTRSSASSSRIEEADEDDPHVSQAEEAFLRTYVRNANSPYARAFRYDKNWTFAMSAELATRGALFMLVASIPLILGLQHDKESFFYHNEMFNPASIVMFVYTLYKSVGETVTFAIEGMCGTIAAALAAFFMFGLFEHGYNGESWLALSFGILFGTAFTILTLWLNFSTLTQVFLLSNFVWHWMRFLDPDDTGFSPDVVFGVAIPLYGFDTILTSLAGCMLAIATICLPYPMLAISQAVDVAEDIVMCIGETWDVAVAFYCNNERDTQRQTRLRQKMTETRGYVETQSVNLDSSWWECVLVPTWWKKRLMLIHMHKASQESFDRLTYVITRSCTQEEFDEDHAELMKACSTSLKEVIHSAKELMVLCMESARKGYILPEDEAAMEKLITKVKEHEKTMTKQFLSAKEARSVAALRSLLDEHVFSFEVCVFGRLSRKLAKDFVDDAKARRGEDVKSPLVKHGGSQIVKGQFLKMFNTGVLTDREHINFAVRNSLSILFGMLIGYWGYSKMISALNAGIASTSAVLLSKYSGSAVAKNLGRLQGVVVGELVGELVYALLGWCAWWGYVSIGVLLFVWLGVMLFTYYHSEQYGFLACLAAAFGTSKFLQGCSGIQVDPLRTYHDVINCLVAIFVMMIVDYFLGLGIPSQNAHGNLLSAWRGLKVVVERMFDGEQDTIKAFDGTVLDQIGQARVLSKEACEEPRGWKTPWQHGLFMQTLKSCSGVRLNLVCMMYAVGDFKDDAQEAEKEEWFKELLKQRSFETVLKCLTTKMDQIEKLSQVFLHGERTPLKELKDPIMQKQPQKKLQKATDEMLMKSVARSNSSTVPESMEDDEPAQLCFIVSQIESLYQGMLELQLQLIESAI